MSLPRHGALLGKHRALLDLMIRSNRQKGARDFVVPSRMNPGPLGFAWNDFFQWTLKTLTQEVLKKGMFEHRKL